MKSIFALSLFLPFCLVLGGCTSKTDLEKTLMENPEILMRVIKAHPKAFLDTLNEAVELAKTQVADERMEEAFKTRYEPVVENGRVVFGPETAEITIVEYSDFQCEYCRDTAMVMKELRQKYGDKIRVVYKHLPLDIHPQAVIAAQYFEAIGRQGGEMAEKFHDLVFESQNQLGERQEKFLEETAKKVGANVAKVKADLKSKEINARIDADIAEAQKFEFSGTPGFLVNGVAVRGAYEADHFSMIIDRLLAEAK